jgi:hypothetical protein
MKNNCGCDEAKNSTSARAVGLPLSFDRNQDYGGMRNSHGTVLDNTSGLAGVVKDVSSDHSKIIVESVSTAGVFVRATLEAGFPDIFDGIATNDIVFCAVVPLQLQAELEMRGICFWILKFGTAGMAFDQSSTGFSQLVGDSWDSTTTNDPSDPDSARDAATMGAAGKRIGAAIDGRHEISSASCTIAALKASINPLFIKVAREIVLSGYFPVGYECCPGALDSRLTGYVLVAFRFRNTVNDERLILVPVKLSTWAAAGGLESDLGEGSVREVDAAMYHCSTSTSFSLLSDCVTVTTQDGNACLNVPYAGDVCISVPNWVPNGTVAEACYKVCKKYGVPCGVKVWINALGQRVASNSWGCC